MIGMYVIGLIAQVFFSARMLIQWVLSEKQKRVVSPVLYWVFSLIGAYLLCIYGWLRNDFAIILGQFISYYIYLWNLNASGIWHKCAPVLRALLLVTPILVAVSLFLGGADPAGTLFRNPDIPLPLLLFGCFSQALFTLRFVYQWWYSSRRHVSVLPMGFWVISLTGSLLICLYAILRLDIVLILGQALGLAAYARNIVIGLRSARSASSRQSS